MHSTLRVDPISLYERTIIRLKLAWIWRRHSWNTIYENIEHEMYTINDLVQNLDDNQLQQRVEIQRFFGLSKSSTAWSPNQVVEHLVLETGGIIKLIEQLNEEIDAIDPIDMQSLQPIYNKAMHKLLHMVVRKYALYVETNKIAHSKRAKVHPYFGKLNSKAWHTWMALHLRTHRKQLEHLIKRIHS